MADSNVIIEKVYPVVAKALDTNSKKYLAHIHKFMTDRHSELFNVAPYDRIIYNKKDSDALFKAIGIEEKEILELLKDTFYWNMDIRPKCIKEPYVIMLFCCIRYFLLKKEKDNKNAELSTIYLCFTGKFYASLHSHFFKYLPNKAIMEYVVNNMLSNKFDLKKEGTIFGVIAKMSKTWLETYSSNISNNPSDDDIKLLVQQLRDRESSFLRNILNLYIEASQNKYYLNYETDDLSEDNFRLTSNDALKAANYTESTMNKLTSQRVPLEVCNSACALANKNTNDKEAAGTKKAYAAVKPLELKDIMETVLGTKDFLPEVRRVLNILICDFMANEPGKRVGSTDFINYCTKSKHHTKSDLLIEQKQLIDHWLEESSPAFRKRRNRLATANNYFRCVLCYLVLMICKAVNDKG